MSRPLLEGVADLLHQPGARRALRRSSPLGEVAVTAGAVPPGADVDIDVVLESVTEGILVTGTVGAPYVAECRRCLRTVPGRVQVEVQELFAFDQHDEDSYPLRHDQIDLEPLAREAVLLGMPLASVCRPDCAGLCPQCGADLNEGPCECPPAPADPRWSVLDVLRNPEDE